MENEASELIKTDKNEVSLIDSLSNSPILKSQDLTSFKEAKEFVLSCFTEVPMYRSLPVKIFGVLNDNDFPTAESKYWQCKVEAEVHSKQIIEDMHDLEMMNITLEKCSHVLMQLDKKYNAELNPIAKKDIEFDIREQRVSESRLKFKLYNLQKQIKYRIEEVTEWKKITEKIAETNNISDTSYVNQYINNIKHSLHVKAKEEKDDDKKKQILRNLQSIDILLSKFK